MTNTQDNIVRSLLADIRAQADLLTDRIAQLESYMRPKSDPNRSPAASPAPVQGRARETSAAGGVSTGVKYPALTAPTAPSKRNGHAPPANASAAPAQASSSTPPTFSTSSSGHVYLCKDRPGLTYTLAQLIKRTGCSAEQIQMEKPGQNGWRLLAGVYFKRSVVPAGPSAVPMNYESKPRARGEITPINPNLVGRAAVVSHADHG